MSAKKKCSFCGKLVDKRTIKTINDHIFSGTLKRACEKCFEKKRTELKTQYNQYMENVKAIKKRIEEQKNAAESNNNKVESK